MTVLSVQSSFVYVEAWQNVKQQKNRSMLLKTLEYYFTGLDPMSNGCKRLKMSLMLSAAYVSSTVLEVKHTHSYTQGCRLHNTSAPRNASQYYWLTQDTVSSPRSSWKDPVHFLLASIFICLSLSLKPINHKLKVICHNLLFHSTYETDMHST